MNLAEPFRGFFIDIDFILPIIVRPENEESLPHPVSIIFLNPFIHDFDNSHCLFIHKKCLRTFVRPIS